MTTQTTQTATNDSPTIVSTPDLRGGSTPEAAAVLGRLFGVAATIDPPAEDDSTAAETSTPEESAEATTAKVEPASTEEASEPEDVEVEIPVRGIHELRKVAAKQAHKREERGQDAARVRELEARLAALEANPKSNPGDVEAAAAFRKMQTMAKDSPIDLLEALGVDVVSFLQSGHRQALDRQGHSTARTIETLSAQLKAAKEEIAEIKAGVPQKFEERELREAQSRNQREFFALTSNVETYPLLAAEDPADQLRLAGEAVAALGEAGYNRITHKLVADVVEKTLRDEHERRTAALGRGATSKSSETQPAQDGGDSTAKGRRTTGKTGAATTLSNAMAAEGTSDREMTPRERETADRRTIAKIFGVPER